MAKFGGFGGKGGMGGGMGNMQQLLKQAQAVQQQMEAEKEKIASLEVEGTAGGGLVKVRVKGDYTVLSVTINPDAVDKDDVEMLEDLLTVAINDAISKIPPQPSIM